MSADSQDLRQWGGRFLKPLVRWPKSHPQLPQTQTAITWDQSCKSPHSLEIIKFIILPKLCIRALAALLSQSLPQCRIFRLYLHEMSFSFLPSFLFPWHVSTSQTRHIIVIPWVCKCMLVMFKHWLRQVIQWCEPACWPGCVCRSAFVSRSSIRVTQKSLRHHFCLLKSFHEFDRFPFSCAVVKCFNFWRLPDKQKNFPLVSTQQRML